MAAGEPDRQTRALDCVLRSGAPCGAADLQPLSARQPRPAALIAGLPPISAAEFAAWMGPLGPFGSRRIAVAVSGGADSTALCLLAAAWGVPLALIVDHGLRPGSAAEAEATRARLAARGIAARVLTLTDLTQGPGLPARARNARYAALAAACKHDGLVDLLVGHHAADQAETVLLRCDAGSGVSGLAGMAALVTAGPLRLLRPLLAVAPGRLRATLVARRMAWIEDPTNRDLSFARARVRASAAARHVPPPDGAARQRAESAPWPADVAIQPGGFACLLGGDIDPATLAAAVWTISGRPYPPPADAILRLARIAPATLHGVQVLRDRDRGGWLVAREPAGMAGPRPARPGADWDGRFVVLACEWADASIGALGGDAARLRRLSRLPAAVLRTLPAIRRGNVLSAVPHLAYPSHTACASVRIAFRPARPLAGSPFVPVAQGAGVQRPTRHPMFDRDGYTDRAAPSRPPGFEDWIV